MSTPVTHTHAVPLPTNLNDEKQQIVFLQAIAYAKDLALKVEVLRREARAALAALEQAAKIACDPDPTSQPCVDAQAAVQRGAEAVQRIDHLSDTATGAALATPESLELAQNHVTEAEDAWRQVESLLLNHFQHYRAPTAPHIKQVSRP